MTRFSLEEFNNMSHSIEYWLSCTVNGLSARLHKDRQTMYISGLAVLEAFPDAGEFNAWRNAPRVLVEGRELDLSQIALEFAEVDLAGRKLTGFNLSVSRFEQVNLTGADLTHCNLSGTFFQNVDLRDANLAGALVNRWTALDGCCLVGASLAKTALPALLRQEFFHSPSGNGLRIKECELWPGFSLSLPSKRGVGPNPGTYRIGQAHPELEAVLVQLAALLEPVDPTGMLVIAAQALIEPKLFNQPDPHTIFIQQIQQKLPDWPRLKEAENLVARTSAALVMDILRQQ